jgi:D-alanyl-D-alanine carboxypeptidase
MGRGVALLCVLFLSTLLFALPVQANSKYASLVIDADSGKILHSRHADARRYPASLTKLMTLYLTFEALDEGRLSMDTKMRASARAAGMPQTNVSLREGDRISVRDAIIALVVRSANDVAVVIAEHLGKTEPAFARMMTRKAQQLGMKKTTFRNASGLPDRLQRSTAKDLVLLAVSLQRRFPQYYHFFENTQFTFKGRTYKSHNRVLKKLPGADGLKTGYINASGFNLITSARRNGRKLVGVVLGGKTSRSRDAHMVELMERTFARMDYRHNIRQFSSQNVPTPKGRPGSDPQRFAQMQQAPMQLADAGAVMVPSASSELQVIPAAYKPTAPLETSLQESVKGQFEPTRQPEAPAPNYSFDGDKYWGVQVGAFKRSKEALIAAVKATTLAENELQHAKIVISDEVKEQGVTLHRARLANLEKKEAKRACQKLKKHDASCFIFRMASHGSGQDL